MKLLHAGTVIKSMQGKDVFFIALGAIGLLLIPLVANWPWTLGDFAVAGVLLFGIGLVLDVILRKVGRYRWYAAALAVFLFLWLWAELAVGLFTNWGS